MNGHPRNPPLFPHRPLSRAPHPTKAPPTADLITALDNYNRDLNGPVPSETVGPDDDSVPRTVAYAVGEVVRMLRESGSGRAALRVETAWLAVLAGDIDDIGEHLAEEGID